jgi:predicted aspartyl protease
VLLAWAIEFLYLAQRNANEPARIKEAESKIRKSLTLDYEQKIRKIEQEYEEKKHLATGETVFDRIYNTQNQSIADLIKRISNEALPDYRSCDVKVEEFTHYILLIYRPYNARQVQQEQVISYLDKRISQTIFRSAKEQGQSFTRFNSATLKCEKKGSHLFLPLEVAGPKGVVTCYALFDTGASITTFSEEVVLKTGIDNLQIAPRRSFRTAGGFLSCPIVKRDINVGGFRKNIDVAVNQKEDVNLLGMNFFEGMEYIVDFQNSSIYVWEK